MGNRVTKIHTPVHMAIKWLIPFLVLAICSCPADAKQHRSYEAKAEFKRLHPCPANGHTRGPCPGYIVDHVKALKRGGADDPSNMQWQTIEESKAKDKWE